VLFRGQNRIFEMAVNLMTVTVAMGQMVRTVPTVAQKAMQNLFMSAGEPLSPWVYQDNGESWAGRAQAWMFDLFDLAWGMRNADEHRAETQRLIRLAKYERAIRRLYRAGESLPHHESHPFRDPIEDVLFKSLCRQERWLTLTEEYLPRAAKRVKNQQQTGQRSLTAYAGWSHTPRISS
jgi:hypothetical protein